MHLAIRSALILGVSFAGAVALADSPPASVRDADAVLVDDFLSAVETYSQGLETLPAKPTVRLWLDGMRERGIDPTFLERRLAKARGRAEMEGADPFARYKRVKIETFTDAEALESAVPPVALHAFRLDVVEDYDDVMNDDIYCYFITTHDDLVWGKVTETYRGLDEGTAVFFSPTDRGLFGPTGETLTPRNHTLVDIGIIESDSGDAEQLQQLSDAIVDLALVALTVYDPNAGAAAAQARAETKNLLALIIGMDDDDRLVTDTLAFTPHDMAQLLSQTSVHELSREYDGETFWTHFTYRLSFRLLR